MAIDAKVGLLNRLEQALAPEITAEALTKDCPIAEAEFPNFCRCKDCAHWRELKDSDPSRGVCKIWHTLHHGGWFCHDGERRDDDG